MPTTIGAVSARSPNSVRYPVTSDGSPTTPAKTQAELIADCAEGPLKAFLRGLTTTQFNALLANPALTVLPAPGAAAVAIGCHFSGGNMLVTSGANANGALTLRFVPSAAR